MKIPRNMNLKVMEIEKPGTSIIQSLANLALLCRY